MLKITRSFESALAEDEIVWSSGNRADETVENLSKFKKSKNNKSGNLTHVPTIKVTREPIFLNPGANEAFNYLKQAFIKASILWYFDLESNIRIETDILGYAIGRVFSQ